MPSHQKEIKILRMKKILIAAVAALALLSSCKKDNYYMYGAIETGNFNKGVFVTDNGLRFTIRENLTETDISTLDRAIIMCDIYGPENTTGVYEIRLRNYAEMAIVEPLLQSAVLAEREFSTDPLSLTRCWRSGNYINLGLGFMTMRGGTAEHRFDVIVDDTHELDDSLRIRIEHFADGEYPGSDTFNFISSETSGCYLSVPTEGIIAGNPEKVPFKVTLSSYKYDVYGDPMEGYEIKEYKGDL